MQPHVVIVGGGFGGLTAAQHLRRVPVRITLLDRRNFHLFQPLLYQVATGTLSPANIASPLRAVLNRQRNLDVLLGDVIDFDAAHRRLRLRDGELSYDSLVVAAGSRTGYFGHDDWAELAPGLKSIEDATDIRRRILLAFEAAERETDPDVRREWLTFLIVGGGPTGVELAGALAEIARNTLRNDFRHINPSDATILLIDGSPEILSPYSPRLREAASRKLRQLGITIRTGQIVKQVSPHSVEVSPHGSDQRETLRARTILWAAGVQASELGPKLAQATGCETDRGGRVMVQPDLTIPGHPEIFVIGDLAHAVQDGHPLPGVAPVAIQQGKFVARTIAARRQGRSVEPFRYRDLGSMATVGRGFAIVEMGRLKLSGYIAWLIWLFVHLIQLVGFQSRILVLIQWGWNYFTFNRAARLITGEIPTLADTAPAGHSPDAVPVATSNPALSHEAANSVVAR